MVISATNAKLSNIDSTENTAHVTRDVITEEQETSLE